VVRDGDSVPGGRRFPIRFKLAAALTVPMVALLFVATTKVLQVSQDAEEANEQAELAKSASGPGSLVRALQTERNHTAAFLVDQEAMVNIEPGAYLQARPATDEALADFRGVIEDAGGQVLEAYQPAVDAMAGLGELRRTVDEFTGTRDLNNAGMMQDVFDGYLELTNQLFDANRQVSLAVNDLVLRRGAALVNLSTRNSDTVAVLTRTLVQSSVGGDRDGVNTPTEISRVASLLAQLRRNEVAIRENGVGVYRSYVESLFASEHTQRFPEAVQNALDTSVVDIGALLGNAGDREAFGYDSLLEAVEDELDIEADRLTEDASRTRTLYLIFGIAMVLLGAVMTWLVSRSITRPLRSLTRQATAMANEHLPGAVLEILETPLGEDVTVPNVKPIDIRTRDEVSDVAEALNTVQTSALDLAVEQAVLRRNIADSFVNLGRRNQNLLSRQLDFITELERNETDPDALASLFRLDHLATRMRRNAESLLVLAGIDPPRKWAAPVALTDVIRAALSEIEDYQRVNIVSVEPATVVGSAAADLAHLLAELMENGVTFSAPDQTVEVRGRSQESGYMLAVIDSGLGMPAEEIERANRRLAGAESFTIAPSKYLGHYVTGNLAARHGIKVELHNSTPGGIAPGGITATITLPPGLLTADQATGAMSPSLRSSSPALALEPAAFPQPALATNGSNGPGRAVGPLVSPGQPAPPYGAMAAAASALAATADPSPTPWESAAPVAFDPSPRREAPAPTGFDPQAGRPGAFDGPPTQASPLFGSPTSYGGPVSQPAPGSPLFDASGAPQFGATPAPYDAPAARQGPEPAQAGSPFEGPPARRTPAPPPFGAPTLPSTSGREHPGWDTPAPGADAPSQPASAAWDTGGSWQQPGTPGTTRGPAQSPGGQWGRSGTQPGVPSPLSFPLTPARGTPAAGDTASSGNGGRTRGGLTRRVRGAQVPSTHPLHVRRSGGPTPASPTWPAAGGPPQERPPASGGRGAAGDGGEAGERGAGGERQANDVYSFLSTFRAGVQRGLDQARNDRDPGLGPPDDPDRRR
jgi:HAMP domain-containing protein